MLTAAELVLLRGMIDEPDETGGWTDERLNDLSELFENPDGSPDLAAIAAAVWDAKAASYATLNDVTESGSSRRLSQTFDQAQKMALHFRNQSVAARAEREMRMQSHKIVRPTRG